ncbi:MAG: hypothetical protein ACRDGD_12345, partial [Candidatus Limnocylindria bacterium]
MFIPRTLAELDGRPGGSAVVRALVIGAIVAAALFLILSANITLGQEDLAEGQVAEGDIRAPRDARFDSESLTDAARDEAAEAIQPLTEVVEPPADNQEDQLAEFDLVGRRVSRILEQLDSGTIGAAEAESRLAEDVPEVPSPYRDLVANMTLPLWEDALLPAARAALGTTLADSVREDEIDQVRTAIRDLITTDLAGPERGLAGELAAEFVEPNVVIDEQGTQQLRDQARAEVPPVPVTVSAGEIIVREGSVLDVEQIEKLEELGLTRPRVAAGTVFGNALVALLMAGLLVGYLWRFAPEIWHRNRSVLLFFLALIVSAVAIRVAADRTLWAFVVPTTATVLLTGILLGSSAGATIAAALAVLAGVMNRDALDLAVYVLAGGLAA